MYIYICTYICTSTRNPKPGTEGVQQGTRARKANTHIFIYIYMYIYV